MKDQSYKLFLRNEIPKQSQAFDAVTASFSSETGVSFGEPSHGPKYPRVGLEVQFQGLKNSQELRKTLGRRRKLVSAKTLTLLLYRLSYYANYRVGQQYPNSTSCFFIFFLLTFLLQLGFFLSDTKPKCIANIPSLTTQHVYLEKRPYLSFCWTSMLSRTNTPNCWIGEYFKGTFFHIIKN